MKIKLFIAFFLSFFVSPFFIIHAAEKINSTPQEKTITQSTQELAGQIEEVPAEEAPIEEAPATEVPAEEAPADEVPVEEGVPAEEEAPAEEEVPAEEEAPAEEEPARPAGFVTKWADMGFAFDELEVAALPPEVLKEKDLVIPEVTELDIDFEGLTLPELEYLDADQKKDARDRIKKSTGLSLNLPIIGPITLDPLMIDGEYGYELNSPIGGRTINAGIFVINKYTMRLIGQEISFTGEGSILGKKGKIYLKRITTAGLIPKSRVLAAESALVTDLTLTSRSATEAVVGDVEQMVMSFVYDAPEKPKFTIVNMGEFSLESTDIVFQKNRPVLIIGTARILGVQAEVGLAVTKRRVNAFINVQMRVDEKCKDPAFQNTVACTQQNLTFKDVIPQIGQANKSLGDSAIKDLIFKIHNLVVISPAKVLKGISSQFQETTTDSDLRGTLTATISLEGTDLATDPALIVAEVSAMRKLKDPTQPLKNPLEAQVMMEFNKFGYEGKIFADLLYLKNVGKIENPSIDTSIKRDSGSLQALIDISGDLLIPISGEAPLRVSPISVRIVNSGITVFGSIPEFSYKKIHFNNLELSFDSISKEIILQGSKVVGDFEIQVIFRVMEPSVINCEKQKTECMSDIVRTCKERNIQSPVLGEPVASTQLLEGVKKRKPTELDRAECKRRFKKECTDCELTLKQECDEMATECGQELAALSKDEHPKREIEFKARLVSNTVCSQKSYGCKDREIEACKKKIPELTKLLQTKKIELKNKELQAITYANENKVDESNTAWEEYEVILQDTSKLQGDIENCIPNSHLKCREEKAECDRRQALALRQLYDRADVTHIRTELEKDRTKKSSIEPIVVEKIEIFPFKNLTKAPEEIKSIKLTDIDVGIELRRDEEGLSSGSIYFKAIAHAFGVMLPCDLKFVKNTEGTKGVVLTIPFTHRVTLEQLAPYALKGAPYNTIYIEKPKIIISTLNTYELSKGVIISGYVPLAGGLDNIGKLLGKQSMLFGLKGVIDFDDVRKSLLEIILARDIEGLTTQEKCKKELIDCIKKREVECDLDTSKTEEEKQVCKNTYKTQCHESERSCQREIDQVVSMGDVVIGISLEPSFSVRTGITIRPPMQKNKIIKATGRIELKPDLANITAYMQGTWYDAFTLPGWELSDVAFHIGQKYGSPIPTEFGGAGRIKIVGKSLAQVFDPEIPASNQELKASVDAMETTLSSLDLTMQGALMADIGLKNMALEFKTTKVITWTELLLTFAASFFSSINKNELSEKLVFINSNLPKITDLEGNYAARDVRIGAKLIARGMGLGFRLALLGKQSRFKMQIRDDGIEGIATFEKIDTPFFKLTGAGEDKILGNADDAPIIRATLNLLQQEFYVDGQVELILPQIGSLKSLTRINIGFNECRFLMEKDVFGLFKASIEARLSSDLKNIFIKGKLNHDAYTIIEELLKKAAQEINKQAIKDINFAQQEVTKALNEKDIVAGQKASLDHAMKDVQQKLSELTVLKAKLDAAARACGR